MPSGKRAETLMNKGICGLKTQELLPGKIKMQQTALVYLPRKWRKVMQKIFLFVVNIGSPKRRRSIVYCD